MSSTMPMLSRLIDIEAADKGEKDPKSYTASNLDACTKTAGKYAPYLDDDVERKREICLLTKSAQEILRELQVAKR